MSGHGEKLSRKQDQAIVALLAQPTIPAAAMDAGVSPATLWRWLQHPEFLRAYRAARLHVVERSIAELQDATGAAVRTLREVMTDPEAPAASRVTAARVILDTALRGAELLDIEQRLADLESLAAIESEGWRR